jgi:excisionase family DNA binding protein
MSENILAPPDELTINGVLYIRADGRSEDWLSVKQAARLVGKDVHAIYNAIKANELDGRKPNGSTRGIRVRRGDLMAWATSKAAHE